MKDKTVKILLGIIAANLTFQTFSLEVPKSAIGPSPAIPKSIQLN